MNPNNLPSSQEKATQILIDNQFDFSKFVLTINENTKLQHSSISISLFEEAERDYIRKRLKAMTLISEIILDETIRNETISYFIEDIFNMSALSRTKEAWLIKQIFAYANPSSSSMPLDSEPVKEKTSLTKKTSEL